MQAPLSAACTWAHLQEDPWDPERWFYEPGHGQLGQTVKDNFRQFLFSVLYVICSVLPHCNLSFELGKT